MWKILKSSITGEQHIAAHRPCQDRYMIEQSDDRLILAVADGHGGSFYCRSEVGAQFACEAAIETLCDSEIPWEEVGVRIKELFDRKVSDHLWEEPLTSGELVLVNGHVDEIAYGTTLICCCVTSEGTFSAQIGDGDMCALTSSGTFLPPLPEDENCIGFFTTSLISHKAAQQFRWHYDTEPAAVVALYTDGYVPRMSRPWKLMELAQTQPDAIPQEILDAGQRGDDQTVLVAIRTDAVGTPEFQNGYAEEHIKYLLEERQMAILRQINDIDSTIKIFIKKLAKCEDIRMRNRLIERLSKKQDTFLTLCEEYRALEEVQAQGISSGEDPEGETTDPGNR